MGTADAVARMAALQKKAETIMRLEGMDVTIAHAVLSLLQLPGEERS